MKLQSSILALSALVAFAAHGQKGTLQFGESANTTPQSEPPRTWKDSSHPSSAVRQPASSQPTQGQVYVYDQQLFGSRQPLVSQKQAQVIVDRFKEVYPKLGSPRLLIYINRDLVDEQSGMKLTRRVEKTESSRSSGSTNESTFKSTGENTYRADGKTAPTLADRQTTRDIERLFGRPLRAGGASLADQRVAAQMIADRPLSEFIGSIDTPQARKDREALSQIADAVVEVLISSKTITVPGIGENKTISIPDIQATAIRLKDSKVLAQVSSTDITDRIPPSNMGTYGVNEITEATALALMEDLASNY
jgi:predicted small lipoprotein YifL